MFSRRLDERGEGVYTGFLDPVTSNRVPDSLGIHHRYNGWIIHPGEELPSVEYIQKDRRGGGVGYTVMFTNGCNVFIAPQSRHITAGVFGGATLEVNGDFDDRLAALRISTNNDGPAIEMRNGHFECDKAVYKMDGDPYHRRRYENGCMMKGNLVGGVFQGETLVQEPDGEPEFWSFHGNTNFNYAKPLRRSARLAPLHHKPT